MTKPHSDRILQNGEDKGFSIRVGRTLPPNSANLAYVQSKSMSPKKNLLITDLTDSIPENGLPSTYESEKLMYPDEDFLLRELSGASKLPSRKIVLSDEFSIPATTQDKPVPLYYLAQATGLFDAKGAPVAPYQGGYVEKPVEKIYDYAQIDGEEAEVLLYFGDKIRITYLDGTPLKKEHKYKIKLVKASGSRLPQNAYYIHIYTNFRGSENETFVIRYEKYNTDGTHTNDYVEVLNAYPFFSEISKAQMDEYAQNPKVSGNWREELNQKIYSVVETEDNMVEVYAPSQVLVANNVTRPAHQFQYRVKANLKTRFSNANPGTVKIGIAYLNNSVFGVEDLTGTIKKLYEDGYRPPYLDFDNPHHAVLSDLKENPRYWQVDLSMPAEHWNDYDLIVITGYGFYDMSPYNDAIRNYLENGGKIWIDNGGTGDNVLSFTDSNGKETFLTNIGFSKTINETGFKSPGTSEEAQDFLGRLYVLQDDQLDLGYTGVNPRITFGAGESLSNWKTIVRYSTNQPAVIYRSIFGKGEMLVSNCGIFRSLFHNEETDLKFAINTILTFAERKWIFGPWVSDYVYHRDNLFQEEYKGINGQAVYIDDRNDLDPTQIVAKKILAKSTRQALIPYMPKSYFNAKGTFEVEVQSDNQIPLSNHNMEIGSFNEGTQTAITQWSSTTTNAIPGWDAVRFAGSAPLFKHVDSISQRGTKAIQIIAPTDGTGSHAFWRSTTPLLVAGTYRATVWLKTENVNGITASGATIGVYKQDGTLIALGTPILGTRDWLEVKVDFTLDTAMKVELRVGFVDGNGEGTVSIDYINLYSMGSVYMTPENDGNLPLYAYAVKPRGETFDLKTQGFSNTDITTYDPEVEVTFTIRSFVFAWDNYLGRYMRKYGNLVTEKRKIRRSDGVVNLGSLSTMLPPLNSGAEWADRNKVYYEIFLGGPDGADTDSRFVNLEVYDKQTGQYYYTKNGEIIIRYMDLFYTGENKNILLQARTNYYTVRATKRRYGVLVQAEDKIKLEYPSTLDDRDCWFLRIRNGSFVKKDLNYQDVKALSDDASRLSQLQDRPFGIHYYSIPEYYRQVFKPSIGIKRVTMERAEYINDFTIKVQNAPMVVQQGSVRGELLRKIDTEGKFFKASNSDWLPNAHVRVYTDEDLDNNYVQVLSGFDVDFKNGIVKFDEPVSGNVKADYDYNNLKVFRRRFNHVKIRDEELTNIDGKTFVSKNQNWLPFPTPVVRLVPYGKESEPNIAPVTSYTIDYQSGSITFHSEINDRVLVDYAYSNDEPLPVRDYDVLSGHIFLEREIDFKDEIVVSYYYEENFLEYRGYFDEEIGQFIHLDLNPSEGHYCTLPVVNDTFTTYEQVPTAKLMNKEVYIYMVPHRDSFGNRTDHTVRHCYSLAEWEAIQKANPASVLLGIVHLREHTNVKEVVVMDTRSRGGGLKEEISREQIKKVQPQSLNYWDMGAWDGMAYYKNGVVVIEIPKTVLKSWGGQFTEQQVREIVRKHIAYGVYPIIEFV